MTVELLNPEGLPQPDEYRQVAVATGSKIIFLAGQVARDADGNPVGPGDLAAQVDQALRNVNTAMQGAGGTFADIAKLTIYIVDWNEAKMPQFIDGVGRAMEATGIDPTKATTLLGVSTLAEADLLVEIEATGVID